MKTLHQLHYCKSNVKKLKYTVQARKTFVRKTPDTTEWQDETIDTDIALLRMRQSWWPLTDSNLVTLAVFERWLSITHPLKMESFWSTIYLRFWGIMYLIQYLSNEQRKMPKNHWNFSFACKSCRRLKITSPIDNPCKESDETWLFSIDSPSRFLLITVCLSQTCEVTMTYWIKNTSSALVKNILTQVLPRKFIDEVQELFFNNVDSKIWRRFQRKRKRTAVMNHSS